MYVLGVDLGSRSTKCVIIDGDLKMVCGLARASDTEPDKLVETMIGEMLKKASIDRGDIRYIVSTGYGRDSLSISDRKITEITCHAAGAHHFYRETGTVIDIGGQDSKVISINEKGKPVDFIMNDKCAAGTGKFIEMMSRTLNIPIEELGRFDQKASKKISINSICTVFAESEVISLMAEKETRENIIRGLHTGVAERTLGLVERIGMKPQVTMTGGVARNPGVVRALERCLKVKMNIPEEPELTGAFGAAILGMRKVR
jgi:predicted CoA-substrate-specific enzyme activase